MRKLLAIFAASSIFLGCGNESGTKPTGDSSMPEPTVPVYVDTLNLTGDTGTIQ